MQLKVVFVGLEFRDLVLPIRVEDVSVLSAQALRHLHIYALATATDETGELTCISPVPLKRLRRRLMALCC